MLVQYFNSSRRSCRRGSIESYLSSFETWDGSPNPSGCLKRHVGAQLIAGAGIRQECAKLQLNDLARLPDVTHIWSAGAARTKPSGGSCWSSADSAGLAVLDGRRRASDLYLVTFASTDLRGGGTALITGERIRETDRFNCHVCAFIRTVSSSPTTTTTATTTIVSGIAAIMGIWAGKNRSSSHCRYRTASNRKYT